MDTFSFIFYGLVIIYFIHCSEEEERNIELQKQIEEFHSKKRDTP